MEMNQQYVQDRIQEQNFIVMYCHEKSTAIANLSHIYKIAIACATQSSWVLS